MDLASSKQSLLKNLQELPNPSSSEAVLLGRPSAVASTMASSSRKKNLPSVLKPKAEVAQKTIDQTFELLANSIANKFTSGPFPDRRLSVSLYDKDSVLLLANHFIEINLHYSLPTLILALQTLLDDVCAKNPRKYPNPVLVRAIEVRYFNEEKYTGLPRIEGWLGGDDIDQDGKVAEFIQWKEDMVGYWERFKRVMLVRPDAQTIAFPILKVRTVDMITDWDGPHGIEVIGNGHTFGNTLIPKQSPVGKEMGLAKYQEMVLLHAAAARSNKQIVDSPSTSRSYLGFVEGLSMLPNNMEAVESPTRAQNNNEIAKDTMSAQNIIGLAKGATTQRLTDPMDREQGFTSYNVESVSLSTQEKQVTNSKAKALVPYIEEKVEKSGSPKSIASDNLDFETRAGRSSSPPDRWMVLKRGIGRSSSRKDGSQLNHMAMVRIGLQSSMANIRGRNEALRVQRADTWAYYQQLGGEIVIQNLFKLDHMPFVPRPAPVQEESEGDISIVMVPYRHITFDHLYPAEARRIINFREREEAAESFDSEDDGLYIPDGSQRTSTALSLFNPPILKGRNRKEVQASLHKVLDGAINRRASANHNAYIESLANQRSSGSSSMFTPTGNLTTAARTEAANRLNALSSPFVPFRNSEKPPGNQTQAHDAFATPSPQPNASYDSNAVMYSAYMNMHLHGGAMMNDSFPAYGGMTSLFATQEDYDAYQLVAANDAYRNEQNPYMHSHNPFNALPNTQAAGANAAPSVSNYQGGMNAYGNTEGYSNNQATGSYHVDAMPRNNLVARMDDLRGIHPSQSFMTPNITARPRSGYGSYMDNIPPNQQQHGLNNQNSGIDLNSSLATAFNGNTNPNTNNLQVPQYHTRGGRKNNKTRSRKSSKNRLVPSANPTSSVRHADMMATQGSVLRADSSSFAPEFRWTESMYQDTSSTTARATTAAQGEVNSLATGATGVTATTAPRSGATVNTKQSDPAAA